MVLSQRSKNLPTAIAANEQKDCFLNVYTLMKASLLVKSVVNWLDICPETNLKASPAYRKPSTDSIVCQTQGRQISNIEVTKAYEVRVKRGEYGTASECKGGETGDPEKTRRPAASSGTIPICENPGGPRLESNPVRPGGTRDWNDQAPCYITEPLCGSQVTLTLSQDLDPIQVTLDDLENKSSRKMEQVSGICDLTTTDIVMLKGEWDLWTVKWKNSEDELPKDAITALKNFGLQGITAKTGSGLLEMCFFRRSHVEKEPAPKDISEIDPNRIICWKTLPIHEGKADNIAVINVFGNASMYSHKKMTMELGDQRWLHRKLVGTVGDMNILASSQVITTGEKYRLPLGATCTLAVTNNQSTGGAVTSSSLRQPQRCPLCFQPLPSWRWRWT
ncbi:hypothetical protein PR048_026688 [Dryococelus australis]|uniref:Uncharacterized protein n=1 Tax=Dryococelus australis TaxID=614101 RepID=A0ABQ9GM26_9NEOP|nr:hypothetical protein PR048_026688 [Dryococelus australis]